MDELHKVRVFADVVATESALQQPDAANVQ